MWVLLGAMQAILLMIGVVNVVVKLLIMQQLLRRVLIIGLQLECMDR